MILLNYADPGHVNWLCREMRTAAQKAGMYSREEYMDDRGSGQFLIKNMILALIKVTKKSLYWSTLNMNKGACKIVEVQI